MIAIMWKRCCWLGALWWRWCEVLRFWVLQYPEVDPTRAADGPDVGTRGRTVKSDLSFVLSHWRERAAI